MLVDCFGFFLSDPPQKRFISAMGFVATGIYEAVELRDGGKDYMGKGVRKVKKIFVAHLKHNLVVKCCDDDPPSCAAV
jgi:enolase